VDAEGETYISAPVAHTARPMPEGHRQQHGGVND